MQRTNKIQLMPNKRQKKILQECMLLSSCVYNMTNYEVRQQFFNGEKVSGFFDLQQKIQNKEDYQMLGRSYALPRIQIYSETNSARFKLIKSKTQKRVGLPKYLKNRKTNTTLPSYLVIDGSQYSIKKNHVIIPLSRQMRKKHKISQSFRIKYNGILKWSGLQKRGQIKLIDGKFYLYQSVDAKDIQPKKTKIKAGLDLGIKRLLSIFVTNNTDYVIGSNRFYKQWQYLSNIIFKEQSRLELQGRKSSRKLSRLFCHRKKWQDNLFNNLIAKMFRVLNKNKVSELVVGDLTGIREDNSKGKRLNKMTHNYWSFDILLRKIQNKAEEFGIQLNHVTEEYTSKTCSLCGTITKPKDRIFICSDCGHFEHRDVLGAKNILFKSMYGSNTSIHLGEIAQLGVSV